MRVRALLGVLGLLAAPAMASPVTYTFDVNPDPNFSSITLVGHSTLGYLGTTSSAMTGTFAITIYQTNEHIGTSDTFILGNANVENASPVKLVLFGVATANVGEGSARFLDFDPEVGHIEAEPNVVNTDVYVRATAIVTGLLETTFSTAGWAGEMLPFLVGMSTSVEPSGTIHATISGEYTVLIDIDLLGPQQITLDLIVELVGTAHAHAPEPALSGLAFLGLSGAGAWLRRRRR